jgi:hypothetical protein
LTRKVAEFDEWDEKAIEKHQDYMAKLAVEAWKIKL